MKVDGCSPQFFLLSLFPVFFRCFLLPLLHIRSIPMSLRYERLGSEFSLKAVLWRIVNDIELVHLFGFVQGFLVLIIACFWRIDFFYVDIYCFYMFYVCFCVVIGCWEMEDVVVASLSFVGWYLIIYIVKVLMFFVEWNVKMSDYCASFCGLFSLPAWLRFLHCSTFDCTIVDFISLFLVCVVKQIHWIVLCKCVILLVDCINRQL